MKKFIKYFGPVIITFLTILSIGSITEDNYKAMLITGAGIILMEIICGINWVIFDE